MTQRLPALLAALLLVASQVRAQAPEPGPVVELPPSQELGGVDFARATGRYRLSEGKAGCSAQLSVLVSGAELWAVSPAAITSWKRSGRVLPRPGGMAFSAVNAGTQARTRPWSGPFPGADRIAEETTATLSADGLVVDKRYRYQDPYAKLKTRTTLRFDGDALTLTHRDSTTGAPLESGFWQSLGLKGKKLDLDLDCTYTLADRTPYRDEPVAHTRHRFQVPARVCASSCILQQEAVVTVAFDMEAEKDVNGERLIRDLSATLELKAGGALASLPAYALRTPPETRRGYAKQSFRDGSFEFFLEPEAPVDGTAAGTVVEDAIGQRVFLKLFPYCSADLSNCRLGALSGLDGPYTGMTLNPRLRLLSDDRFAMISEQGRPRFPDGALAAR